MRDFNLQEELKQRQVAHDELERQKEINNMQDQLHRIYMQKVCIEYNKVHKKTSLFDKVDTTKVWTAPEKSETLQQMKDTIAREMDVQIRNLPTNNLPFY
jgi:2-oxoglutarate dehydrogenase complex dehydrogenase (E1) component-like enzyme